MELSLVIKHRLKASWGNMCASKSKTWTLLSGLSLESHFLGRMHLALVYFRLCCNGAVLLFVANLRHSDFKLVVEDFTPRKPGQGKHQGKNCHAKSEPSPTGSTPASADTDADDEDVKPKKRI